MLTQATDPDVRASKRLIATGTRVEVLGAVLDHHVLRPVAWTSPSTALHLVLWERVGMWVKWLREEKKTRTGSLQTCQKNKTKKSLAERKRVVGKEGESEENAWISFYFCFHQTCFYTLWTDEYNKSVLLEYKNPQNMSSHLHSQCLIIQTVFFLCAVIKRCPSIKLLPDQNNSNERYFVYCPKSVKLYF